MDTQSDAILGLNLLQERFLLMSCMIPWPLHLHSNQSALRRNSYDVAYASDSHFYVPTRALLKNSHRVICPAENSPKTHIIQNHLLYFTFFRLFNFHFCLINCVETPYLHNPQFPVGSLV